MDDDTTDYKGIIKPLDQIEGFVKRFEHVLVNS